MIFAQKRMMNLNNIDKTRMMLIFLISTILGSLFFGLIGNLLASLFLGINTLSTDFDVDLLPQQQYVIMFRITQPFNTIGLFLFPPLVVKYIYRKKSSFSFSDNSITSSSIISASFLIIIVKPIVSLLSVVNNNFDFEILGEFGETLIQTSKLLTEKIAIVAVSDSIEELMLNIFIIALIPAIAEEFFFRGFLQRYISQFTPNYHLPIWITAIAFGFIHLNIINLLPLIFLGAILGYIYHFSQNIWVSVLAHFINNAFLLWVVYKYSFDINAVDTEALPLNSIILSIVLTLALLYFMYSAWENRKAISSEKI